MSALNYKLLLNLNLSKKNKILFLITIYGIAFSIFLTIIGQLPVFSTRGITQLFQLTWIVVLIPIVLLSYKRFLVNFLQILLFLTPFLLYLIIALIFDVPSWSSQSTTLILLSAYMFLIGKSISGFVNRSQIRLFAICFFASALIYAGVLYFSKIRGVDISGSIYAVSSKNSAGPIFIIAAFCTAFVFTKKNIFIYIVKAIFVFFFVVIIALMKCRTILIAFPFVGIVAMHFNIKNNIIKLSLYAVIVVLIVIVFTVPFLNQRIIHDILLNGKTEVDDIFSGRISQIVTSFSTFKPFLGSGYTYVDCMPIQLLLNYGIIGFLFVVPFLAAPYFVLINSYRTRTSSVVKKFVLYLLIIFAFEILLEGYGHYGPGAKSFVVWLLTGLEFKDKNFKFLSAPATLLNKFVNKISPLAFTSFVCSIFTVITLLAYSPQIYSGKLSSLIGDKLPSSTMVTDYYDAGDVKVSKEVPNTLCVGQTITIDFIGTNKKCDEIIAGIYDYDVYQESRIIVDRFNKTVTPLVAGNSYIGYQPSRTKNGYPLYFTVQSKNSYEFTKIYISSNSFSRSFDHKSDESITIGVGSSSIVYYDNFYIPAGMDYTFISSDENIAFVDKKTGIIDGVNKGTCTISYRLMNDSGNFYSKNSITVTVVDEESYTKCTSMNVSIADKYYMYEPLDFSVLFNKDASDVRYKTELLNDIKYEMHNDKFVFLEEGVANIKITSISNPLLSEIKTINILNNKPLKFVCDTTMLQVGKEYNPHDYRLYLEYSSGHKIVVSDDVLSYDPLDYKGRAWHEQNGMIHDHCSIKTVKTGTASIKLTCKYDKNITASYSFKVIKTSIAEYEALIRLVNIILIGFMSAVSIVIVTLIKFKKRIFKTIMYLALAIIFSVLLFAIFGFTRAPIVIFSIIVVLALILSAINQLLFKDDWPNIFSEDFEFGKSNLEDFNKSSVSISITI